MSSEPFIICDNLVKIYKIANLEVFALQGLDLVVAPGELMGIVGASGSGKSTLMNILGGLDRPSAGRVWVGDNDLLKMSDAALNRYRRSKVGFVWQQAARNLIPYLSAVENVQLPMTLAGNARGAKKRANDLLELVGLGERSHHALGELSGGEQQRVAIAVSLANSPTLLLADEPTGEVDSQTALSIYQTFQSLNRELGLTILIVSHDTGIARHVQRVVAIRDGKLASETVRQAGQSTNGADGTPQETHVEDVFEEMVVLDSAGRLQIPKDYLAHFNIQGRAKLEMTEDGILIVPAGMQSEEVIRETRAGELIPTAKRRNVRDMFRLGRGKKAS
jgi:putative ABC transport system ATP-binding protein